MTEDPAEGRPDRKPDRPAGPAAASPADRRAAEVQRQVQRFRHAAGGLHPRTCPICRYQGFFTAFGQPPRHDARCGDCQSLERHRLFKLWMDRVLPFRPQDRVLHVGPDPQLGQQIRPRVARYETADIAPRWPVNHRIDIEDTGLPDARFDWIICIHLLEHVDDRRALAEIARMLKPGGSALIMSPVVEGWATTYEDASITDPDARRAHFGQSETLRVYGRDIRDRIRAAGLSLTEFTAVEPDVLTYGLIRGESLFIARKARG